jgi:putative oxidoreductase
MAGLQSWSLLALRAGTGLLLILWGGLRVMSPAAGPGLADKYYSGLLRMESLQIAFGVAEIAIGILVVLGLFRRFAYPLQALVLVPGSLMLWRYLIDPMGTWLLSRDDSQILFFPSITVAAASLVLVAFRDFDRLSLDARLGDRSVTS